jgi:hypothetical protein
MNVLNHPNFMLELHCHTTYSDGTLTPAQLVDMAIASGVREPLAITIRCWDGMKPLPQQPIAPLMAIAPSIDQSV